jgi:hypothetical protein
MKELKFEMKLVKILELLHEQKTRVLEDKPILYTTLSDIYQRVEILYDTIKNNQYTPEYYVVKGTMTIGTNTEQKGNNE